MFLNEVISKSTITSTSENNRHFIHIKFKIMIDSSKAKLSCICYIVLTFLIVLQVSRGKNKSLDSSFGNRGMKDIKLFPKFTFPSF